MSQKDLKQSLYDYVENRDTYTLIRQLEQGDYLKPYDGTLYRGFTTLANTLEQGDIVPCMYGVTSWTSDFNTAKAFADYNKELIYSDYNVLEDLGLCEQDIDEYIIPTIFVCNNPASVLNVSDYIDSTELQNVEHDEYEFISYTDTYFVVDKVNYVELDNYSGYVINVSQLNRV